MHNKVISRLKEWTGHSAVKVTARGNAAFLYALFIVRKKNNKSVVAIPDQGGWLTYKTFPLLFGWRIVEYPTRDGVVDIDFLRANVSKFACVIVNNPGGYAVTQPMTEIFSVCDGKTLVVEDVSGSIGDICSPAHIKVGSFGEWKPMNVGIGGFISSSSELLDTVKEVFKITFIEDSIYERIWEQMQTIDARYSRWREICRKVVDDLSSCDVVYDGGIVVIVKFKSEEEKEKIVTYCGEQGLEYTECPRYIRLEQDAVCVEVKRVT